MPFRARTTARSYSGTYRPAGYSAPFAERIPVVQRLRVPNGGNAPGSSNTAARHWDVHLGHETSNLRRKLRGSGNRQIQEMLLLLNPLNSINAVALTSTGRCALAGLHDGSLQLWDLRSGNALRSFIGHTEAVYAVAVAPDDGFALSGSADRRLLVWSVATGELLHSFTEHGGPVTAVSTCPDGRYAVSGSHDRTLRVWDVEERICRAVVPLEGAPLAVALAPTA